MAYISHTANVILLIAVCSALFRDAPGMADAFGPGSLARCILACVYLSTLIASAYALAMAAYGAPQTAVQIAIVLFPLPIIYKTASAFTVGIDNPVVEANLAVVALHSVTLTTLWLKP